MKPSTVIYNNNNKRHVPVADEMSHFGRMYIFTIYNVEIAISHKFSGKFLENSEKKVRFII